MLWKYVQFARYVNEPNFKCEIYHSLVILLPGCCFFPLILPTSHAHLVKSIWLTCEHSCFSSRAISPAYIHQFHTHSFARLFFASCKSFKHSLSDWSPVADPVYSHSCLPALPSDGLPRFDSFWFLIPFFCLIPGNQPHLPSPTPSLFLLSLFELFACEATSPMLTGFIRILTICLSLITSLPVPEGLSASVRVCCIKWVHYHSVVQR